MSENNNSKGLIGWIDARFPLTKMFEEHLSKYYAPKNFNFWYFFGSLALLVLVIQIVTGIFLTMHYKPDGEMAFSSVEYIMRDVDWGWLIRYLHSTGSSAFFIVVYLHMFRALIYGSYKKPRELIWLFGMFIFLALMAEAFMGYLLPWGQMSYWGAQVIISLFGAIPVVGDDLTLWIRGDFVVSDATLNRFFALHVVAVPIMLLLLVVMHIIALHEVGSNNPDGVEIKKNKDENGIPLDGIPFHPYYSVKDLVGVVVFLILFSVVVFFMPEMGGYFLEHANFVPANQFKTPEHIPPFVETRSGSSRESSRGSNDPSNALHRGPSFTRPPRRTRFTIRSNVRRHSVVVQDMSLFCMSPSHPVRKFAAMVVAHRYFDRVVFASILLSAVFLAISSPDADLEGANSGSSLAKLVDAVNWIVAILFTGEMVFKVVAQGFVLHPKSYLRDTWNILDFCIVVVSWGDIAADRFSFFKAFRALRALRPLRLITRFQSMRVIINSLFAAVPALGNVLLVCFLFFTIFGILGVWLFKGRMRHCISNDMVERKELNRVDCIAGGHEWANNEVGSFDNIGAALLILFEVASLENWPALMLQVLDSTDDGEAPSVNNTPIAPVYFITFIVIGAYFIVSLFVTVVVDEYNQMHARFTGAYTLSAAKRQWLQSYKNMAAVGIPARMQPPFVSVMPACMRCGTSRNEREASARSLRVIGSQWMSKRFDLVDSSRPIPTSSVRRAQSSSALDSMSVVESSRLPFRVIRESGSGMDDFVDSQDDYEYDDDRDDDDSKSVVSTASPANRWQRRALSAGCDATATSASYSVSAASASASNSSPPSSPSSVRATNRAPNRTPDRTPDLFDAMTTLADADADAVPEFKSVSLVRSPSITRSHSTPDLDNFLRLKSFSSNIVEPSVLANSGRAMAGESFASFTEMLSRKNAAEEERKRLEASLPLDVRARLVVFQLVESDWFEWLIILLVALNALVMSLEYFGSSTTYSDVLEALNVAFVYVFLAEMLLKWFGLGVAQYFSDSWNRFDAFVVVLQLATFVLPSPADATLFRVVRVIRIFRLVKRAEGLKALVRTLIFSLPALSDIGLLLLLLLFIYACVGMELFGSVRLGTSLTEFSNFRNFLKALLTLYQLGTGDDWNGVMHDCSVQPPMCTDGVDCGSPVAATLFFYSFSIVSGFLLLNVFVAVVLKNFEAEVYTDPIIGGERSPFTRADIELFAENWADFTSGSGSRHWIPVKFVGWFINHLDAPLGLRGGNERYGADMLRFLSELEIPQYHSRVHYFNVLYSLAIHAYARQYPNQIVDDIEDNNAQLVCIKAQVYRRFQGLKNTVEFQYDVAQASAVVVMQRAWRRLQLEKMERSMEDSSSLSYDGGTLTDMDEKKKKMKKKKKEVSDGDSSDGDAHVPMARLSSFRKGLAAVASVFRGGSPDFSSNNVERPMSSSSARSPHWLLRSRMHHSGHLRDSSSLSPLTPSLGALSEMEAAAQRLRSQEASSLTSPLNFGRSDRPSTPLWSPTLRRPATADGSGMGFTSRNAARSALASAKHRRTASNTSNVVRQHSMRDLRKQKSLPNMLRSRKVHSSDREQPVQGSLLLARARSGGRSAESTPVAVSRGLEQRRGSGADGDDGGGAVGVAAGDEDDADGYVAVAVADVVDADVADGDVADGDDAGAAADDDAAADGDDADSDDADA